MMMTTTIVPHIHTRARARMHASRQTGRHTFTLKIDFEKRDVGERGREGGREGWREGVKE